MQNYLIPCDNGTAKLVRPKTWDKITKDWKESCDVIEFIPYQYNQKNIDKVCSLVKTNLTNDMRSEKYKEHKNNPMFGHCVHSSQAIFWLIDTAYFISMRGEDITGELHWWLLDTNTDKIIDATKEQFDMFDYEPPYDSGKKTTWHTWKGVPKKQTLDLIQKIQPNSKRYNTTEPSTNFGTLEAFL